MNKIKAIILDLDGTLLDDNEEIGNYTKEVLKSIKDDVKIILASARQFCRIKPYLNELSLIDINNYSICLNGALVVDNTEKILHSSYINPNIVCKIDKNVLNHHNEIKWIYYTSSERVLKKDIYNINYFTQKNIIYKIVGISNKETIHNFKKCSTSDISNIAEFSSSTPKRIEIVSKGTDKLNSTKLLLEKLGIDKENCIAIGDGENDIPILQYVGYGVVMKNAPTNIKEKVKKITKYTNNEDGVGKMIEEMYYN